MRVRARKMPRERARRTRLHGRRVVHGAVQRRSGCVGGCALRGGSAVAACGRRLRPPAHHAHRAAHVGVHAQHEAAVRRRGGSGGGDEQVGRELCCFVVHVGCGRVFGAAAVQARREARRASGAAQRGRGQRARRRGRSVPCTAAGQPSAQRAARGAHGAAGASRHADTGSGGRHEYECWQLA